MTVEQAINEILELAKSQIGYKEHGKNGNKYAHDFDTIWTDWFNGKKDYNDWCAIFVAWLFVKRFEEKIASKMLNHSSQYGKLSAVVQYLYRCLMEVNRVGKDPHPGDIIFYHNDKYEGLAQLCHVGIVWKVEGDYVTTIEGNSGKDSTEVATRTINKNYDTKSWGIYGFGYPDYSPAADEPGPDPDPKTLDGYTVGEEYQVVCKDTLNVRVKATVDDSDIITALNPGTKIICRGLTRDTYGNTWMRIDDPVSGWIAAKYDGERYVDKGSTPKTIDGFTVGNTYTVNAKYGLNVRTGPSKDYKVVDAISYGTKVKCYDVTKSGNDTWVKISSDSRWVAAHFDGDWYLVS